MIRTIVLAVVAAAAEGLDFYTERWWDIGRGVDILLTELKALMPQLERYCTCISQFSVALGLVTCKYEDAQRAAA